LITALMLLPLGAVLIWIYGYLLPERWCWTLFDALWLLTALLLGAGWIRWAGGTPFAGSGPVFGDLVAAAGAYPIFAAWLALGLGWRRRSARQRVVS
jgi:hypothetical protein